MEGEKKTNVWFVVIVIAIICVVAYGGYQIYSNYTAISNATKTA